jgi:hypothetical protein
MIETTLEKRFWRYWLGGLLLLAIMIATNAWFVTDISPWGIRDHQAAGTAVRIDAIQAAWAAAGVMNWARFCIALDLVYIAVYSYGAYCGGRLFGQGNSPALRRIGWVVTVCAIIVCLADYTETICQFIQAMRFRGSDTMAKIAATAQPIKSVTFLTTFIGLLAALFFRRMARSTA